MEVLFPDKFVPMVIPDAIILLHEIDELQPRKCIGERGKLTTSKAVEIEQHCKWLEGCHDFDLQESIVWATTSSWDLIASRHTYLDWQRQSRVQATAGPNFCSIAIMVCLAVIPRRKAHAHTQLNIQFTTKHPIHSYAAGTLTCHFNVFRPNTIHIPGPISYFDKPVEL